MLTFKSLTNSITSKQKCFLRPRLPRGPINSHINQKKKERKELTPLDFMMIEWSRLIIEKYAPLF